MGSYGELSIMANGMRPIHPGELPKLDVLDEFGMSANALAQALVCRPIA
jgi:plasmid maintenance system antidote protein VapI